MNLIPVSNSVVISLAVVRLYSVVVVLAFGPTLMKEAIQVIGVISVINVKLIENLNH